MTEVRYAPGEGVAVVREGLFVLLGQDGNGLARDVWERSATDPEPATVLDVLLAGGFAALPDFVCLWTRDGALTAICHGDLAAEVTRGETTTAWSGADARTWREYTCPLGAGVHVRIGGAGGRLLPLGGGIAAAGALEVGFVPAAAPAGAPEDPDAGDGDNEFAHLFGDAAGQVKEPGA